MDKAVKGNFCHKNLSFVSRPSSQFLFSTEGALIRLPTTYNNHVSLELFSTGVYHIRRGGVLDLSFINRHSLILILSNTNVKMHYELIERVFASFVLTQIEIFISFQRKETD